MIVACVLRSGGDYLPEHVTALRDGVARHLRMDHRFICLTDVDVPGVETIRLRHDWPGWWSKIELLLLPGPVLTLDLDTLIVGPLDDIATGQGFTMLRDFYRPDGFGSGVMAWGPRTGVSAVYSAFYLHAEQHMREYVTADRWGDQAFIARHAPVGPATWQDRHPGRVVSFKADCRPRRRVPDGTSIVAFHGHPRPWQMTAAERAWFPVAA